MTSPRLLDILEARNRLRGRVRATPLHASAWLSERAAVPVHLKLESVQLTGSFKIRGAFNALLHLQRGAHVVTSSAGNHGRAVALAAEALGIRATVFTPRDAPETKVRAIRRHGADLRQDFKDYDAAEAAVKAYARESGATFVSPYSHPDIIAGAGTIALELLEQEPALGTIVVAIGGGGLISGVALAAKTMVPDIRIVGVEADASAAFAASRKAGRIVTIDPGPTVADGLGGNMDPETITFGIIEQYVDEIVTVTEHELLDAIRGLVREEHLIAEGAGAAATAAVLAGKVRSRGPVAALLSGGNIDAAKLTTILGAGTTPPAL